VLSINAQVQTSATVCYKILQGGAEKALEDPDGKMSATITAEEKRT
jgi:hypothetical protein